VLAIRPGHSLATPVVDNIILESRIMVLHNNLEKEDGAIVKPENLYSFSFVKIDGLSALILGLALVVVPPTCLYYSGRSTAKINICKAMALKQVGIATDSLSVAKTFNDCLQDIEKTN
jgi:hypothetical protein